MKAIEKQFKQILLTTLFLYCVLPAIAQSGHNISTSDRKNFYQLLREANLKFTFPAGFKVLPPINNDYFSFDYDMEIPGDNFEMWLEVKSQKQNWASYVHAQYDQRTQLANPDSMYLDMGQAMAIALTGNKNYQARNMPPEILSRYNADAGKSYLLNLLDMPMTRHYKYALIVSLQKNHTGTLVAIFFTNDKDPDFYRNVNRAAHSFKFIAQTTN